MAAPKERAMDVIEEVLRAWEKVMGPAVNWTEAEKAEFTKVVERIKEDHT